MISPRTARLLDVLREEFRRQSPGPYLSHALLAYRDDQPSPTCDPEQGLSDLDGRIDLPGLEARIVAYAEPQVIEPARWTDLGDRFAGQTAAGMIAAARSELVESPGIVADSIVVSAETGSELEKRHKLFKTLAAEAGRVLCRHEHGHSGSRTSEIGRWLLFLHELGWRGDAESGIRVVRKTWANDRGRLLYLPFETAELERLGDWPTLPPSVREQIEVPPLRYVSLLEQDLFRASRYAIDDLAYLLDSGGLERRESASEPNRIAVVCMPEDVGWMDRLGEWLEPADRGRLDCLCRDDRTNPSEKWRGEVLAALPRAGLGLLVVTQSLLNSRYFVESDLPWLIATAREAGVPLMWIPIDQCSHQPFAKAGIQALGESRGPWAVLAPSVISGVLEEVAAPQLKAHFAGAAPCHV